MYVMYRKNHSIQKKFLFTENSNIHMQAMYRAGVIFGPFIKYLAPLSIQKHLNFLEEIT